MHFAYPPRKSSDPPPFRARSSKIPLIRRSRIRALALVLLAIISLVYIVKSIFGGGESKSRSRRPSGGPSVVLVTILDRSFSPDYLQNIQDNRIKYAEKHGYETFFAKPTDYDLRGSPLSWAKIVAIRHALSKYPDCRYVWYLNQDALIMNPALTVESHVMEPWRLEAMMIRDKPVVPPDSIIRTFSHLRGEEADFVLTQDRDGLSAGSFIVRNGDWAKFLVDTWYDPIYRSYNFQRAETHALEHIVQWHPTILSKLALVPQRTLNSYANANAKEDVAGKYAEGDWVLRFPDCPKDGDHSCEKLAAPYMDKWRAAFAA